MIIKSKLICVPFFAFYLFLGSIVKGQALPQKEVEKAITTIARLIEENYVFKDKGKAIAAHLKEQFK